MKVVIVSGGNPPPENLLLSQIENADIIIGADSGCDTLIKYNITPTYIIGDFDSNQSDLSILLKKGAKKYIFEKEKDKTDSELAFELAKKDGVKEIIGLGMTGTRYDHTLANFGLLKIALDHNIIMQIIDENNKIFLTSKSMELIGQPGDIISFQSYTNEVTDFCIKNAKYELNKYNMKIGDSRTVSNEFVETSIEISFSSGIVMVIYSKD